MKQRRILPLFMAAALFLGSYRGYLAIFEKSNDEPKQIFPCKVESLPEADQKLLQERIRIRNQEQLNQLLEDYLS